MEKIIIEYPEDFEDWKEEKHVKNCLNYIAANFKEIEPIIRQFWINKEKKKLEKDNER